MDNEDWIFEDHIDEDNRNQYSQYSVDRAGDTNTVSFTTHMTSTHHSESSDSGGGPMNDGEIIGLVFGILILVIFVVFLSLWIAGKPPFDKKPAATNTQPMTKSQRHYYPPQQAWLVDNSRPKTRLQNSLKK